MPYVFCDPEKCTGCRACELVCSGSHERVFGPGRARIRVVREEPAVDIAITCRQCSNPPCAKVCPVNAIRKLRTGLVEVDSGRCIGCALCVEACPFGAISLLDGKAIKCDLCGGSPACVKQCMPGALRFVAPERIAAEKRSAFVMAARPKPIAGGWKA
ncbi:MAG: 4Fe-4S dicluster domain-containing protein [Candidatus Hodarchaeaceae archaeon]|nr:4Fe-4S dicluster domain-containing protein [Candidatus Hodarchaeaceae archaeon]